MCCHFHQALWTVGSDASYLGFSRECKHTPVLPSENHTEIGEKKWKVVRKSEQYGTSRDNYSWLLLFGCEVCIQRKWVSMAVWSVYSRAHRQLWNIRIAHVGQWKQLWFYMKGMCVWYYCLTGFVFVKETISTPVHVKKKKKRRRSWGVWTHIYYFRFLIWNVRSARAVYTAARDVINTC